MSGILVFIQNELAKVPDRQPDNRARKLWIRCPNPEHSGGNERTPSCAITYEGKYAGRFRCFGCKEKGHWNKLAEWMHLAKLDTSIDNTHEAKLNFKRFSQVSSRQDMSRLIAWPASATWRGINGDTLRNIFNVHLTKRHKEDYLVFPVTLYGQQEGTIDALLREPRRDKYGKKEVTYINSPGPWAEHVLFNFDYARRNMRRHPLWIVEGPRDTCNVAQHGGRVVGLIGSAVTRAKVELIRAIDPPLIIKATDNDTAGNHASDTLSEELAEWYPMLRYNFTDGRDPADLTKDQIARVHRRAKAMMEKYRG